MVFSILLKEGEDMSGNYTRLAKVKNIIYFLTATAVVIGLLINVAEFHKSNNLHKAQMISELSARVWYIYGKNIESNINVDKTLDALYLLFKYKELDVIDILEFELYTGLFRSQLKDTERFTERWSKVKKFYQSDFQSYIDGLLSEGG